LAIGLKKWAMLQMWRVQQVAQMLTLVMLAATLSLQVWRLTVWRGEFMASYAGLLLILLVLAAGIWAFAFVWDMRLRMWREQATVLIDRNPFAKEKMTAKEIAMYELMWFPVLERLGENDPKMLESVAAMKRWVRIAASEESVAKDTRELMGHIGARAPEYVRKEHGK